MPISANFDNFTGIANATNLLDRGGDVVLPGAFEPALAAFLRKGFITLAHDWNKLPIAIPIAAYEVPEGLAITAQFHSTPGGEAARTVVRERTERGLEVGLSIGFRADPASTEKFKNGRDLASTAKKRKLDLDLEALKNWPRECRLIHRIQELFEVSIVAVPLNPSSLIGPVKPPIQLVSDYLHQSLRLTRARLGE